MFPMMQCGKEPARTFKMMAEASTIFTPTLNSEGTETAIINTGETVVTRRLTFSSGKNVGSLEEPNMTCKVLMLQSVPDVPNSCRPSAEVAEQPQPRVVNTCLKAKNATEMKNISSEHGLTAKMSNANNAEDKENTSVPFSTPDDTQEEDTSGQKSQQDSSVTASKQHGDSEDSDSEVMRRAQDEGRVNVVFPGTVTQDACCRFVSEILKCILYQRQQLPMTYDQLVYSQKKQQASTQAKDTLRPVKAADMDWRKCQQTLQELEEVLQQLEVLFSLSRVPRVLLLMGGSLILPKELYEINMEALVLAGGDQCLRVSSCLRQIFRTLFVADLLSDIRPVRLMSTTVLALAHRDCGVGWFRPKLQFKVPTRVNNQVIALSTEPSACQETGAQESDWQDYVWFQAPMSIKGFSK